MRLQVTVVDAAGFSDGGVIIASDDSNEAGPAASAPKVLILIEAARRIVAGSLDPDRLLDRRAVAPVADSGLWQHLGLGSLSVADVCALIGSVSDNLATNVLVHHLGAEETNSTAAEIGLDATRWVDQVRDHRVSGEHAESCSTASVAELAHLMAMLHRGEVIDAVVSQMVLGWLDTGVDLSLGAEVVGVDPLAHTPVDLDRTGHRLRRLAVKTGTDDGLLVEMGLAVDRHRDRAIAWATRAIFDPVDPDGRHSAIEAMRTVVRKALLDR